MAEIRIANSLRVLRDQIDRLAPNRDKSSDGGVSSPEHRIQNPNSDHNEDDQGIVHAYDITHDPRHGMDSYELAEQLLLGKDERVKYIISNRKIASGTGQDHPAWVWRPYDGTNPHDMHVHISVKSANGDSDARWAIEAQTPHDGTVAIGKPELKTGSTGDDVKLVQQMLMVDGIFGHLTKEAVTIFQQNHGLDPDGIVGPYTWRALLEQQLPPPQPAEGWQTGITATVFGGDAEVENSAYDGHRIRDSEFAVALPSRFPAGPRPPVEIRNKAGVTVTASIEDVGPWNTNDPYWQTGARPQAESGTDKTGRHTNLAGIDLSPAVARALSIDGKGKVDWRFKLPETEAVAEEAPPDVLSPSIQPMESVTPEQQGSSAMDTIMSVVRMAMMIGGATLATYLGVSQTEVTGPLDQIGTGLASIISGLGALWALYLSVGTKRVPTAVAARPDVPTISPVTGATQPPTAFRG